MQNAEQTSKGCYSARAEAAIAESVFIERKAGGTTVQTATAVPGLDIVGVSQRGYDAGDQVAFYSGSDVCKITAGDAFAVGTDSDYLVTTDSTGRAIPWTAALGLPVLARWVPRGQTAVAANESMIVQLIPGHSAAGGMVVGSMTISAASDSNSVALDAELDGELVFATPQRHDDTLGTIDASWDGSGNLTLTGAAVATADTIVAYFIPVV